MSIETVQILKKGQSVTLKADVDTILSAMPINKAMPISSTGKTRALGNLHGSIPLPFKNPHNEADSVLVITGQAYCKATDETALGAKVKADELQAAKEAAKAARG